jgi:hypothetical protein
VGLAWWHPWITLSTSTRTCGPMNGKWGIKKKIKKEDSLYLFLCVM